MKIATTPSSQPFAAESRKRSTPKTIVHVNQHKIRANRKLGTNEPVISVKTGRVNTYCHAVEIQGPSKILYSPERPLRCGARVWVETTSAVKIIR